MRLLRLATLSYFMADRQLKLVIISVESLQRKMIFNMKSINEKIFDNVDKKIYNTKKGKKMYFKSFRSGVSNSLVSVLCSFLYSILRKQISYMLIFFHR